MQTNKMRATLVAAVLAIGAFAAPAFSATSPGTIKITDPVAYSSHGGMLAIDWVWKAGTYVKSSSRVDVFITNNGLSWTKIASRVPIRSGGIEWSTKRVLDGAYAFRATVVGTTRRSTVSPIYLDNTAPRVDIIRPADGQIIVDNMTPDFAVVAGKATLVAEGRDAFSGIGEIKWMLDDEVIGSGAVFEYDFSGNPGEHVLTAVAFDKAGNSADDRINVVALPGPSGAMTLVPSAPPVPSAPEPPSAPGTPDPGQTPGVPDVDPTESPAPSDPTQLIPTPLPTP